MNRIAKGICRSALVAGLMLASPLSTAPADPVRQWTFDRIGDQQGWTIPSDARGVVMGGSLWLTLAPKEKDPSRISVIRYQVFGDLFSGEDISSPAFDWSRDIGIEALSPSGLEIPVQDGQQIQMKVRILNLSPVTDLYLRWRTKEQNKGWGEEGSTHSRYPQERHCALKSDLKQWQEITCYIGKQWRGVVDQFGIYVPRNIRGDIWLDSVEIVNGPIEPDLKRPDLVSANVVPKLVVPGLSQGGFAKAFYVLDKCMVVDVPFFGFTHPFIAPGGGYTEFGGWWVLDTAFAVTGAKWANQAFAENVMRGFQDNQAQNPDGRIDFYGGSAVRGQVADISQTPRFFEAAYDVARRTSDLALRAEIYQTMRRYLDWWLSSAKRDEATGLIPGLGEDVDTFGERQDWTYPPAIAAVDLNVAVAIGAARISDLANVLGKSDEADFYGKVFKDLSRTINTILWDEKDGAYYNYDLTNSRLRRRLIVTTFDPLRLGIASAQRRDRLIKRLVDPAQFNWGKHPLTSLAMTEPDFVDKEGTFGPGAWQGGIWIYRNMEVVKGLEDTGRHDLAAELNWATIRLYHDNYSEFLQPSTGKGQGVRDDYAWTASLYLSAVIEHLFGVDFDSISRRVSITPHVPRELYGRDIAIDGLVLPANGATRLSVHINQSTPSVATVRINVAGDLPMGDLQVVLPGGKKQFLVPMQHSFTARFQ